MSILVLSLCSRRKYIDFAGSDLGAIWEEYWVETPAAARINLREARKRARGSVRPHLASQSYSIAKLGAALVGEITCRRSLPTDVS